jgi:hypothetical protein
MKTYKDIYEAVQNGATVIITSNYGNVRTYFKNQEGKIRQRFNNCEDSYFNGLDTPISKLDLENLVIKKEKSCKKKKLDKIKAMLIIANAQKQTQKNFDRKEVRTYFCYECNSYHTTSKK